jgi:REP element-mobilizing transposase RayT
MPEQHPEEEFQRVYFVSLSASSLLNLFHSVEFKHMIIDALRYCLEYGKISLYGWCMIPSHLHFIVGTGKKNDLHDMIAHLKTATSKKIVESILSIPENNRKILFDSLKNDDSDLKQLENYKVWEENFELIELKKQSEIKKKLTQIHNAPVGAGLSDIPEDYWYSSARNYAGLSSLIDLNKIP